MTTGTTNNKAVNHQMAGLNLGANCFMNESRAAGQDTIHSVADESKFWGQNLLHRSPEIIFSWLQWCREMQKPRVDRGFLELNQIANILRATAGGRIWKRHWPHLYKG